jgi:hypothetical protein|tara:strand:- start:569 stop:778 length:210 start_codon:yes stop_codon:yes gene_type:complete
MKDTINDVVSGLKWGDLDPTEAHDRIMKLTNQRVIEELKNLQVGIPTGTDGTLMYIRLNKRIKELKREG